MLNRDALVFAGLVIGVGLVLAGEAMIERFVRWAHEAPHA